MSDEPTHPPNKSKPNPSPTGICSAHRDGEDPNCRICYPAIQPEPECMDDLRCKEICDTDPAEIANPLQAPMCGDFPDCHTTQPKEVSEKELQSIEAAASCTHDGKITLGDPVARRLIHALRQDRVRTAELEEAVFGLEIQCNGLKAHGTNAKNLIKNLTDERDSLQGRVEELEAERITIEQMRQGESAAIEEATAALRVERDDAVKANANYRELIKELEHQKKNLENERKHLINTRAKAQGCIERINDICEDAGVFSKGDCAEERVRALATETDTLRAEVERLRERIKNQAEHIRADPVAVLSCVNKIVTEPLECGHDLTEWCDNCETCGECCEDLGGEPIAREIERLRSQLKEARELLRRAVEITRTAGVPTWRLEAKEFLDGSGKSGE